MLPTKVTTSTSAKGFTLIELMLVLLMIGLVVSAVQFNVTNDKPEQVLKENSIRFAGLFDLAAEYSLLNNLELGLHVTPESYQFVAYDGVRWTTIDNEVFQEFKMPELVELSLKLDDLPIDEPLLISETLIKNNEEEDDFRQSDNDDNAEEDEDDDNEEDQEEKKAIIPQVYILSGGDITPFSLSFSFKPFVFEQEEDFYYKVTGLYTTPLTIEGPIEGAADKGVFDE